jgi:hypothetical protein
VTVTYPDFSNSDSITTITKIARLGNTIMCLTCGKQPKMSSSLWTALSKLYPWEDTELISCLFFVWVADGARGRVDAEGVQISLGLWEEVK